jgi:hypothetical protein
MDDHLLIDQGDPEKRIADLERQVADQKRGADLPPAQAPQPANAAPHTGSDSRKSRIWSIAAGLWTGMLLLWIGFGGLGYVAYYSYGYWVGTPTTATIDHCEWARDQGPDTPASRDCTGTWSVGGQAQKGPIKPAFVDRQADKVKPGSTMPVHVKDGTAYTAASLGDRFYLGIIIGPILIAWGSISLWRVWREHHRG